LTAWRVGDHEAAVGRIDIERGRLEHAPGFLSDLDDLARRLIRADGVHRVRASIEHVVQAVVRLLKPDRVLERARDVRRQAATRTQHVRRPLGRNCGGKYE